MLHAGKCCLRLTYYGCCRRRSGVRPLAYAFSMAREMLSSMTRRPKQHAAPQREQRYCRGWACWRRGAQTARAELMVLAACGLWTHSVHEAEHARQHGSPLAAKYAK